MQDAAQLADNGAYVITHTKAIGGFGFTHGLPTKPMPSELETVVNYHKLSREAWLRIYVRARAVDVKTRCSGAEHRLRNDAVAEYAAVHATDAARHGPALTARVEQRNVTKKDDLSIQVRRAVSTLLGSPAIQKTGP